MTCTCVCNMHACVRDMHTDTCTRTLYVCMYKYMIFDVYDRHVRVIWTCTNMRIIHVRVDILSLCDLLYLDSHLASTFSLGNHYGLKWYIYPHIEFRIYCIDIYLYHLATWWKPYTNTVSPFCYRKYILFWKFWILELIQSCWRI